MSSKSEVQNILTKVLGTSVDLERAKQGVDPEWDSLAALSIMFELEETFNIELTDQEVVQLVSLEAITDIIDSHLT